MTITPDVLVRAMRCTRGSALTWARHLDEACTLYAIDTAPRVIAFIAQVGHESQNLTAVVENLNYSTAERVVAVFRKFDADGDRRIDPEELAHARTFLHRPEALANFVYGGRMGNTAPGDGFKYRGRGPGHLTGKDNYEAMRDLLRERGVANVPDFVAEPGVVAEPRWGSLAFAAFWHERGLNELADACRFTDITRRINPGLAGMADRKARYELARKALA